MNEKPTWDELRNVIKSIFNKIAITEPGYKVTNYWQEGEVEVDIVVTHPADRESRLIEAKWISGPSSINKDIVLQSTNKNYHPPRLYRVSNYILVSKTMSNALRQFCEQHNVGVLELEDII